MRIKVKNLILKETQQTNHQVERFKSRFSVLSSNDITSSEKMTILRNVVTLSNTMLDDKSYAIKLGGFSVNKNSEFAIDVNGRFYYRINDDMFKDSTGNEFWVIVRNNKITTFMLRKEIQSTDAATMKDRLRVDDVIFDINKVNSNVEEGLIDEDFESQKVIPVLAENMLKNFIKQYVEKVFLLRNKPDRFMVNSFKGLKFKYGKLNDFVANFMLFLEFDDKIGVGGHFQHSPNSGYGTIALNVDPNTLYSVFLNSYKYGDADNNEIMESMYYALRNNDLISVLIHETQHAYDYYISNGKFVTDKSSKQFYKDKRDQSPKSDEKKSSMKVKYLRLKHEVNARFTQAIDEMPWVIHTNDSERLITPTEYMTEFKSKFAGWDIMTPKIQKYLLRRASQYYYKFKDEHENKKEE